jgi:hypothetical protein
VGPMCCTRKPSRCELPQRTWQSRTALSASQGSVLPVSWLSDFLAGGGNPEGVQTRSLLCCAARVLVCAVGACTSLSQAVGRWAAIAITDSHAAGLSCEGQLYTWGNNNRGQLGLGDKSPGVVDTPVPVQSMADLDVK